MLMDVNLHKIMWCYVWLRQVKIISFRWSYGKNLKKCWVCFSNVGWSYVMFSKNQVMLSYGKFKFKFQFKVNWWPSEELNIQHANRVLHLLRRWKDIHQAPSWSWCQTPGQTGNRDPPRAETERPHQRGAEAPPAGSLPAQTRSCQRHRTPQHCGAPTPSGLGQCQWPPLEGERESARAREVTGQQWAPWSKEASDLV